MKGIIALDIDGTLTDQLHHIPVEVKAFLESLTLQGWRLIFITGRPFTWGSPILQSLQCSYHLAVQNGAAILEMPQKIIKVKKYLHCNLLPTLDTICRGEPSDYIIYSGCDHHDVCYFRPFNFEPNLLSYLEKRKNTLGETWIAVETFDKLPIHDWASVKCFGTEESAKRLSLKFETELNLHAPWIRDPIDPQYYVIQATHLHADKGQALREFAKIAGTPPIIIAAGDDNNDASMFAVADIRVVMETAPPHLQEMADVIAPSAAKQGIIQGLTEALRGIE